MTTTQRLVTALATAALLLGGGVAHAETIDPARYVLASETQALRVGGTTTESVVLQEVGVARGAWGRRAADVRAVRKARAAAPRVSARSATTPVAKAAPRR